MLGRERKTVRGFRSSDPNPQRSSRGPIPLNSQSQAAGLPLPGPLHTRRCGVRECSYPGNARRTPANKGLPRAEFTRHAGVHRSTLLMRIRPLIALAAGLSGFALLAADFTPAPQKFRQETARRLTLTNGLPAIEIQLLDLAADGRLRVFAGGRWANSAKIIGRRWRRLRRSPTRNSRSPTTADGMSPWRCRGSP